MARISGVDIKKKKRVEIALMYLFGVGRFLSNKILKETGISPDKRVKDLAEEEVSKITSWLEKSGIKIEGDLRRDIGANIKRLMDIGSWRGLRHKKGLPVRGQRTSTNARTRKGPIKGGHSVVKKKDVVSTVKPAVKK